MMILGLLCAMLLSTPTMAADSLTLPAGFREMPVESGDLCIVCDMPINARSGIALQYRGRRVPVGRDLLQDFLERPDYFFGKMQSRGALFNENAIQDRRPLRLSWFILGIGIALALLSAALNAHFALRKGLAPRKWFFIGLAGNLFGLLFLLSKPARSRVELPPHLAKVPRTVAPQNCPNCHAANHPSARECPRCGSELTPTADSEAQRV